VDAVNRPEEILHRACVAYLRAALPKPWFCAHVPNGGGRSKAEAGILKAMGVLAGMPDLLVFGPHETLVKRANGVFTEFETKITPRLIAIEFKAPPKRLRSGGLSKASPRLSPAQRARQADLAACGVPYLVIDDLAEMVRALRALGVPLRGRAV
jgi:hypothetical protein